MILKGNRPIKKKRISLHGQVIKFSNEKGLEPPNTLEKHLGEINPLLLRKGWCVFLRSGYVGLTGYTADIKNFIPLEERDPNTPYSDFTNKDGEKKTREYRPKTDVIIVSIAYIRVVDNGGNFISNKWEVKTHWTINRNLFDNFKSAWKLFTEIESRYDPGTIIWTRLDEYDAFENY